MDRRQPALPRGTASIYFGKLPSRGDFVKSAAGARVVGLLDTWIAQGMESLIAAPDWKASYDLAGTVDFLFAGTRAQQGICGSLAPSRDASARRFPFIAASAFEVREALGFLPLSPLVLAPHLARLRRLVGQAVAAADAAQTLAALGAAAMEADLAADELSRYEAFLDTSAGRIEEQLGAGISLRQSVLAVGLLLQPVLAGLGTPPSKALSLPLPSDPALAPFVHALWLELVAAFLPRADFEMGVFACRMQGASRLVVGFNGATPRVFQALFDSTAAREHLVDTGRADWVEDYVAEDYGVKKLASYLCHPGLTLRQLVATFREVFAGS